VFLDELICSVGISRMQLDIICNKEGEKERSAVANYFNLGESTNQDTFSCGNAESDRLYLPVQLELKVIC
jgi:hypothetical protein